MKRRELPEPTHLCCWQTCHQTSWILKNPELPGFFHPRLAPQIFYPTTPLDRLTLQADWRWLQHLLIYPHATNCIKPGCHGHDTREIRLTRQVGKFRHLTLIPMASQARHKMGAPSLEIASRNVVPRSRRRRSKLRIVNCE